MVELLSQKTRCCVKCYQNKPSADFRPERGTCKTCEAKRQKAYYTKHGRRYGKKHHLWQYKNGAKIRGLAMELSDETILQMFDQPCAYCGRLACEYDWNGIDRINSNLGYVIGNVVSACSLCNLGKRNLTHDEFISWIKAVYSHIIQEVSIGA